MRARTLRLALALLLAVATAAACATGGGRTGVPSGADRPVPTITYWATYQSSKPGTTERVMNAELAKFTEQTGIEVDMDLIGWDTLYSRILTAISSGTGPDVVNIGVTWAAPLQATGAFLPFDDAAMSAIGGAERFLPSALAAAGTDELGPPASVPLLGNAYVLFYNTTMFAGAGIAEPPGTWDEFVRDARMLTGSGHWGVGLLGASASTNAHLAFILGRQSGARLVDADGNPRLDSPELTAAVRRWLDLMTVHRVVDPSSAEWSSGDQQLTALADGRVAMVLAQSGSVAHLQASGFTDYAVAPVPVIDPLPAGGEPVRSIVGGTNMSVFANSSHRDAALALVDFLTSDAEQVAINGGFASLPVTVGAAQDAAFDDPATRVSVQTLADHAAPMPKIAEWGRMETVLGTAVSALWAAAATGTLTDSDIAAGLAAADRQMSAGG